MVEFVTVEKDTTTLTNQKNQQHCLIKKAKRRERKLERTCRQIVI